jgi:phenylalanine-4-hydroxylase
VPESLDPLSAVLADKTISSILLRIELSVARLIRQLSTLAYVKNAPITFNILLHVPLLS